MYGKLAILLMFMGFILLFWSHAILTIFGIHNVADDTVHYLLAIIGFLVLLGALVSGLYELS